MVVALLGMTDLLGLQIGTVLLGVGSASVVATGFLWFEERMELTKMVSALFVFTSNNGMIVFLVLVGHLIEESPASFLYLQVKKCQLLKL